MCITKQSETALLSSLFFLVCDSMIPKHHILRSFFLCAHTRSNIFLYFNLAGSYIFFHQKIAIQNMWSPVLMLIFKFHCGNKAPSINEFLKENIYLAQASCSIDGCVILFFFSLFVLLQGFGLGVGGDPIVNWSFSIHVENCAHLIHTLYV